MERRWKMEETANKPETKYRRERSRHEVEIEFWSQENGMWGGTKTSNSKNTENGGGGH